MAKKTQKKRSSTDIATISDSMFSTPTGKSIPYTEVVQFGRLLVDQLKLERESDILTRWLTHYIAELLQKVAKARGIEKATVERECFDAVLSLWRHRADFPRYAPLRSFDAAFKTLESLQSSIHLRYFRPADHKAGPEAEQWLKLA